MGRSDLVRRAMSKKKHKVMEEERKNFIHGIVNENGEVEVAGCLRNGISEEIGNKIFDSMMDFASYAFNKSHAAAYAVVGYQTAYLMYYYPVETIAAMLNSVMGTSEKVAHYINFAESQGVEVLPPDINESYAKFTVKGNKIRFGMAAIRNVGSNVIDNVVIAREKKGRFESLIDFINKIELSSINKRAVESLIKAGAFDEYNVFRSKLLAVYEKLMDSVANEKKRNIDGQISLFSFAEEEIKTPEITYPNIKEFSKKNLLAMEKEMTGLYLTGHPLDEYGPSLKMQTSTNISEIYKAHELLKEPLSEALQDEAIHDDERVILGGIISEVNQKVTRNNTMMAFIKLEDLTSTIEVIVFPKTLDKVRDLLKLDSLVVIKGRVSIKEDEVPKLICETIEPLEKINSSKVYLRVETLAEAKGLIKTLKEMPIEYRGDTTLFIFTAQDKQTYRMVREIWVNLESDVAMYLRDLVGESNVKIMD